MILDDLQRAEYVVVDGEQVAVRRGITVNLPAVLGKDARQLVVVHLVTGACVMQFRCGTQQTGSMHLAADTIAALVLAWETVQAEDKATGDPDVDGFVSRSVCTHGVAIAQCTLCTPVVVQRYSPAPAQSAMQRFVDTYYPQKPSAPVESDRPETGWLVENGKPVPQLRYRYFDDTGCVDWTDDHNKALRFSRRVDAEQFSANDDDAWRIVEHTWSAPVESEHRCGVRGFVDSGEQCPACVPAVVRPYSPTVENAMLGTKPGSGVPLAWRAASSEGWYYCDGASPPESLPGYWEPLYGMPS